MNFEDEEYVRLYSKETVTYKKLGWEGRAVFWHLLLKADRAGVIELDEGDELVEAVAALIDMPEAIVSVGLERLASRGVTSRHGASLIINRFVEAQEAKRSDRLRAQDYRDRKRASSIENIEEKASASRIVTARHDSSLPASPPLPSPPHSQREDLVELELDICLPDLESFSPEPDELKQAAAARRSEELAVFEAWRVELGHPNAKPNPARLSRIRARMREGFTVAQLIQALKNSKNNPFLMGENETNTRYDDLESLLKNGSKVEKLLELTAPPKPRAQLRLDPRNEAQDRNAEHEARADIRTLDRMAQSRRDYELGKRLAAEKAKVASAK